MKTKIIIIATLIAVVLLFSAALIYFFFEGFTRLAKRTVATPSGEVLAELTIHSFDGSYGSLPLVANFGHSFFSIKNLSDQDLTIGNYTLSPEAEVSVGTWGASAHTGIWYSLEAVYYDLGKYDTATTLSKKLDLNNIIAITKHIKSHDYWSFFYNCSAFTLGAWNSVSTDTDKIKLFGMESPNKLISKMSEFTTVSNMQKLENYGDCGYYKDGLFIKFDLAEA